MGRPKKTLEEIPPNGSFAFAAPHPSAGRLRRDAETRLRSGELHTPEPSDPETISRALHELRIHQIELEMQNEELRHSQHELDVARARYFDLYDLAPIGYCTLTLTGVILQTNLTAVTMLGLSRASAIGRVFARFVHPQEQSVLHVLLTGATADSPRSAELRMLRADGSQLWAHLSVSAAQTEGAGIERRVVISDVSARKQAELGRHEIENRYRELFSRAVDGIIVCGPDGTVENVNAAFCQIHGWNLESAPGRNLRELDTKGAALTSERMGRMLSGQVCSFEVDHRHSKGHSIHLEVSTSLIFVSGTPRLLGYYRPATQAALP